MHHSPEMQLNAINVISVESCPLIVILTKTAAPFEGFRILSICPAWSACSSRAFALSDT